MLVDALDRIFAQGIDERMIAAMPDFWKLYYQAAAAKTDYRPQDSQILRQSNVDQKAKLISTVEPPSNELAQANGIAGMALYHAVIGTDGKPQQIVAGRPIGFGLDESAVATIRKATFQPAIKEGKPVPVWLDLVVSFRIYSKRTAETSHAGRHREVGKIRPPRPLQPATSVTKQPLTGPRELWPLVTPLEDQRQRRAISAFNLGEFHASKYIDVRKKATDRLPNPETSL